MNQMEVDLVLTRTIYLLEVEDNWAIVLISATHLLGWYVFCYCHLKAIVLQHLLRKSLAQKGKRRDVRHQFCEQRCVLLRKRGIPFLRRRSGLTETPQYR